MLKVISRNTKIKHDDDNDYSYSTFIAKLGYDEESWPRTVAHQHVCSCSRGTKLFIMRDGQRLDGLYVISIIAIHLLPFHFIGV